MERDTDEWRRPWTDGDGDAADGGGAPRVRRVLRPTPSTLQRGRGTSSEFADRPDAAHGGVDGAGAGGVRPARTVRVRSHDEVDGAAADAGGAPPPAGGAAGTTPAGTGPPELDDTPDGTGGLPPAPPAPQAARAPRGRSIIAVALVAALLGGAVGAGGALFAADRLELFVDGDAVAEPTRSNEDDAVRGPVVESVVPENGQSTVAAVAAAVLPSVVRIDVLAEEDDPDLGAVPVQVGVGSGVIYRSDGYLLTNNHVVEEADALEVQFSDGTQAVAEVVGTDRLTDLAVLKVDRDGLPAINLRQDQDLEVGETAIAIGSPFGLDASVTAGVVSALNRDLEVPGDGEGAFVIAALIQTDAAINPGNSGGALVDRSGQLIGINTAILTGSGGSQGVGFAIPTRSAVIAAEQLIERGFVSHPFLGISGLDVTNEVEIRYRDDYGIELSGGALVDSVVPESGAALGGIEAGDVIVELGGEPISSMSDVIAAILQYDPGDTVDVVVLREGERLELDVELGERPR